MRQGSKAPLLSRPLYRPVLTEPSSSRSHTPLLLDSAKLILQSRERILKQANPTMHRCKTFVTKKKSTPATPPAEEVLSTEASSGQKVTSDRSQVSDSPPRKIKKKILNGPANCSIEEEPGLSTLKKLVWDRKQRLSERSQMICSFHPAFCKKVEQDIKQQEVVKPVVDHISPMRRQRASSKQDLLPTTKCSPNSFIRPITTEVRKCQRLIKFDALPGSMAKPTSMEKLNKSGCMVQ